MITFFRKIRLKLLGGRKISHYVFYAIGEIALVVLGILIALQINNSNEIRKNRIKEIEYLTAIENDLEINDKKISDLIQRRKNRIEIANKLIAHIEGLAIDDWHEFNEEIIQIYTWERFYQHNYTFQELMSSGNLSYLTNDSIKQMLFELESTYNQLKAEEDHWRFDSEELVFKPSYENLDMQLVLRDHRGEKGLLSKEVFKEFFADRKIKNGYVMATVEFRTMNRQLYGMKEIINNLKVAIDEEIKR